jgi:hypothetical protein
MKKEHASTQSGRLVTTADHCRTKSLDISNCASDENDQSYELVDNIEGKHTESGERSS